MKTNSFDIGFEQGLNGKSNSGWEFFDNEEKQESRDEGYAAGRLAAAIRGDK